MTELVNLYIVIDTATRVIKSVTLNPNPTITITETIVKIPDLVKIYTVTDVNTGIHTYWKNVDDIKVPAKQEEIDAMTWSTVVNPDGTRQYWMLDRDNKKVPANDTDISALGIDPERERIKREAKLKAYKDSVAKLAIDTTLTADTKNFYVTLLETL